MGSAALCSPTVHNLSARVPTNPFRKNKGFRRFCYLFSSIRSVCSRGHEPAITMDADCTFHVTPQESIPRLLS